MFDEGDNLVEVPGRVADLSVAQAASTPPSRLLRGRTREAHAFLWAFDLLALDGEDLRDLPLDRRKERLKGLLKRALFGLALNDSVAGDKSVRRGREMIDRLALLEPKP